MSAKKAGIGYDTQGKEDPVLLRRSRYMYYMFLHCSSWKVDWASRGKRNWDRIGNHHGKGIRTALIVQLCKVVVVYLKYDSKTVLLGSQPN
jgi:hypothetical protein